MPRRKTYRNDSCKAQRDTEGDLGRGIQNWKEKFDPDSARFDRAAGGGPVSAIAIDAFLYERIRDLGYAHHAHVTLLPSYNREPYFTPNYPFTRRIAHRSRILLDSQVPSSR